LAKIRRNVVRGTRKAGSDSGSRQGAAAHGGHGTAAGLHPRYAWKSCSALRGAATGAYMEYGKDCEHCPMAMAPQPIRRSAGIREGLMASWLIKWNML